VQAQREDQRRAQREQLDQQLALWRSLLDESANFESSLLPLAREQVELVLAAYASGAALQPWIDARRTEINLRRRHLQVRRELGSTWLLLSTLLADDVTLAAVQP
jgi:hypothetical protein